MSHICQTVVRSRPEVTHYIFTFKIKISPITDMAFKKDLRKIFIQIKINFFSRTSLLIRATRINLFNTIKILDKGLKIL